MAPSVSSLRSSLQHPSSSSLLPSSSENMLLSSPSLSLCSPSRKHPSYDRRRRVGVFARFSGPPRPSSAPRPGMNSRPRQQQKRQEVQEEGPLMNSSIRAPTLRLLSEDNSPMGIVPRDEALDLAKQASLDLVLIAPDADPPVARIMNYGKFRYEQQKKKRDQQRKTNANRQETKELKMRYNIDIGDYNVRLKQALKFLKEGDKVKCSAQFRGREMEFKELGIQLFARFAKDVAEVGVVETRAQMDGKIMQMVLIPNKVALAKAAAAEKKKLDSSKKKASNGAVAAQSSTGSTSEEDVADDVEDDEDEEEDDDDDVEDGEDESNDELSGDESEDEVGSFAKMPAPDASPVASKL